MRPRRTETVLDQLAEFIAGQGKGMPRNLWLGDDRMKVYVRCGRHKLDMTRRGGIATCLDIGSIEVYEPEQKTFSEWFLPGAIKLNPWEAVYVESVMERRFQEFFERNGFTKIGESICPSYFLLKAETGDGSPVFQTRKKD